MKKLLIGAALALPLTFVIVPAHALPAATHGPLLSEQLFSDVIEIKRGGRGVGRGWGRSRAFTPPGWSRGRKVGWRGGHCPPGHARKGWC